MNRRQQREFDRRRNRLETNLRAVRAKRDVRQESLLLKLLKELADEEAKVMAERHGLDENGQAQIQYDTEMDSLGGIGLYDYGDYILPIATVSASTKDMLPTVVSRILEQWKELGIQKLPWEPRCWDGSDMKLVLSQRTSGFWDLYLGQETAINRIDKGIANSVRITGSLNVWNEWEIRFSDESTPIQWEQSVRRLGFVMFYACEPRDASKKIEGTDMFIPAENVQVRFLPTK